MSDEDWQQEKKALQDSLAGLEKAIDKLVAENARLKSLFKMEVGGWNKRDNLG